MKKFIKYKDLNEVQKEIIKKISRELDQKSKIKIYDSIVNLLIAIENENGIEIFRLLSTIKPIYSIQTIYDLLFEFAGEKKEVQDYFIDLKKYNGFDIDVFMLNNVIFCS